MTYEILIETVSAIIENDKINKNGLSLNYELNEDNYNKINEIFYYKANPYSNGFETNDNFEVLIGDILVKFSKINLDK